MRPRANTISHIDGAAMGMITGSSSAPRTAQPTHAHHPSLSSIPSVPNFDYRGMGSGQNSAANGLTKLDTSSLPMDMANGLRTAPVYGSMVPDFGMSDMIMGQGTTINPAQLHFTGSPHGLPTDNSVSPFSQNISTMSNTGGMMDEDANFDWVNGFDNTMSFANANESAVDGSSPSAMSTGSQSGISEVMLDGSGQNLVTSSSTWQNPLLTSQAPSNHFTMDFSPTTFPDMVAPAETVSPKSLMGQNQFGETSFSTPPPLSSMDPSMMPGMQNNMFHPPMVANGDSNSIQQNQMRSPGASNSTDTITDSTRQALLSSLSQPGAFGNRGYSQQSNNSATSPSFLSRSNNFNNTYLLPSTIDLQRYISAYINYFHPHMPFLHIPSLDFETSDFTSNLKSPNGHQSLNSSGIAGGGGCLILSMAAIGALYEFDTATSKDLFESAKKMIQLYLEERRKADMSAALSRTNSARENSVHNTPLWLVQAMLLNVIYGHNCGDKTSADIASTHCAALVSLARAAELTHSLPPESLPSDHLGYGNNTENAQTNGGNSESWNTQQFEPPRERRDWLNWKMVEERKRTLYAIFTLSSLLVSAYNHAPALTNSEIQLDLPCDEDLWAAESPQAWRMLGGGAAAEQNTISFSAALTSLLTASQRQQQRSSSQHMAFGSSVPLDDLPQSELKPSTFGCLVLIHALHNYIWETRQRHMGRQWTSQETDAMHAHIEPALRAWQAAWASNPCHNIERPNPSGAGPLSADSIPLLDLAYVRLFVNLGRSKEAFWQRDWNAMADELARGSDVIQHADDGFGGFNSQAQTHSPSSMQESMIDYGSGDLNLSKTPTQEQPMPNMSTNISRQSSKREQHLRRAAFYAADSLGMSDKLGNTFAEFTSRELPLQCAMCTFDCAQVLAEWVTTLQERIGPYIGILGQDSIDLSQVPGIMLLEEEDIKLLDKIGEILNGVERKMDNEAQSTKSLAAIGALKRAPSAVEGGYGSKILISTAYLLDRAAVWPGKFFHHTMNTNNWELGS